MPLCYRCGGKVIDLFCAKCNLNFISNEKRLEDNISSFLIKFYPAEGSKEINIVETFLGYAKTGFEGPIFLIKYSEEEIKENDKNKDYEPQESITEFCDRIQAKFPKYFEYL